jgi:hypothetical protein
MVTCEEGKGEDQVKLCFQFAFACIVLACSVHAQPGGNNGVPASLQGVENRLEQVAATLEQLSASVEGLTKADARIEINQEKVMEGGLGPFDTPGFPATISEGGSYVLTSDLIVPDVNTTAITLFAVNGVVIDFNGFSIRGTNVCGVGNPGGCIQVGQGRGIETEGNVNGSVIYGGTITGMGGSGISLIGFGNTVRNMTVRNCQAGITATGLILDNVVERNGGTGISSFNGVVKNNFVSENVGIGILLFRGTASDNSVARNTGVGLLSPGFPANSTTPVPSAGYRGNFFADNNNGGEQIEGGTQLGGNVCGVALCP